MDPELLELVRKVDRLADAVEHMREIVQTNIDSLHSTLESAIKHGDDNVKQSLEMLANLMAERVKGVDTQFGHVTARFERLEDNQKALGQKVSALEIGWARLIGFMGATGIIGGSVGTGIAKALGG